ncbi:MAG: type I methionyl aminopeptidase [Deltaproteobacteria bacterium GWA2_38_16]|nr:MAG: type I methionyl aminopeptidase [Deltaproteobacteria bacterium GWA2_38_16]OGQ03803.1 MAG: type I methionyl aminopeptidase [Deltaproteobacteria bacterium RIFCSPHIGHO2_02_FULL_38_15]OGQ34303.1 MAG: type I methionyl aminopeptidase [Deltaproteobacteria bacterium RIFCSPLOWO2_01_FULL_38_9]HBQ20844.1 type I methionyl aminopeptidase [Deltaproteobacteria bacterium]
MIILKSPQEILKMKKSGQIVATILSELKMQVKPGVSTLFLDQFADKLIQKFKVKSAFKGYKGYKHSLCTSINDEVVHGIPSAKRILKEGDIIGMDFGVVCDGYYGDAAISVGVGNISEKAQKLLKVTEESLWKGIEYIKAKNYLSDVSCSIQNYVESHGYSVVREFVGHGIGQSLHEDPPVPNYGEPHQGVILEEGMVLAIEPMVNMGKSGVRILEDGWTVVTLDHSLSAHFEHTIAITEKGAEILTKRGEENA